VAVPIGSRRSTQSAAHEQVPVDLGEVARSHPPCGWSFAVGSSTQMRMRGSICEPVTARRAPPATTIVVRPGTYAEHVTITTDGIRLLGAFGLRST
jgi:hypothetical protein